MNEKPQTPPGTVATTGEFAADPDALLATRPSYVTAHVPRVERKEPVPPMSIGEGINAHLRNHAHGQPIPPDDPDPGFVQRPGEILHDASVLFSERNGQYGDNWIVCGKVMMSLFPDGVVLASPETHEMFGVLIQIVAKLSRFAESGCLHQDSIRDTAVYVAIAEHLLLKNGDAGKL